MTNLIRRDDRVVGMPALLGWDPFRVMNELMRWDPFRGEGPIGLAQVFEPRVEVHEDADAYVISADLPGVDEQDLDLTVRGYELTIAGKRESERREGDATYHVYERSYGSFHRTFRLPDGIDPDHAEAALKNGVLTVRLPKRPEAKPRKISLEGIVDKVKSLASGGERGADRDEQPRS